jgi:uncharacterized membrane-anchored protein YitT (DUF2179 family)
MVKRTGRGRRITETVKDYLLITGGALLCALAVDMFLAPNQVVAAGVTGIAQLANYLWKWPIGTVTLLLNVPLLIAGVKWGGGFKVLWRTIYAVTVMSVAIDALTYAVPAVKGDPLIYTLFGGLLDGIGVGLVLRARGTTGGTDIIAQLLYRYRRIGFGTVFLVSNVAILLLAIPVVGLPKVLYAVLVTYISSRVLDTVQEGLGFARAVFIVTERIEEMRQAVLKQVGRGLTILQGEGGFSKEPKPVLYVVVGRTQISSLKRAIADIDPNAFVVVSEAHEVLGEGFRPVAEE